MKAIIFLTVSKKFVIGSLLPLLLNTRELKLDSDGRQQLRQQRSKPVAEALRQWLTRQRGQIPDGSATRKAIDYSFGRWAALIRYIDDGELPIDNNHIENQIRPVALGRSYVRPGIMHGAMMMQRIWAVFSLYFVFPTEPCRA